MKIPWTELSRQCGIPASTLYARVNKYGMTIEEAMARKEKGPRRYPKSRPAIGDERIAELLEKHRKGMER